MDKLSVMIEELDRIFGIFNDKFYNNTLPKTIINIATNGRKKGVLGWFTTRKVWHTKDGKSYYEITICAEFLDRSIEEICSTLLHEMVHLYCAENEIKEVSRNGVYHNKNFKKIAEQKGLVIGFDKKIGNSPSTLNNTARRLSVSTCRSSVFSLSRNENIVVQGENDGNAVAGNTNKKSSTRKYICTSCSAKIRATKEVNVVCGDCNERFILNE